MFKATGLDGSRRRRSRLRKSRERTSSGGNQPGWLSTSLLLALMVLGVLGIGVAPASAAVVNITLDGTGTGTVTSEPPGVNCSNTPGHEQTDCNVDLGPTVYQVKLFASADSSFVFRGWSGTAGGTCASGSENPCLTGFLFAPGAVTATFGPPPDPPIAATDVADAIGPYAATLQGRVNPGGNAVTGCYFEIGTTTNYGQRIDCKPSSLGDGNGDVAVQAGSGALRTATTYHFRLVGTNVGGSGVGEDRTFTTASAPADDCPNAAERAQQLAEAFPQCMAYEMVSPTRKFSQLAGFLSLDASGARALISSPGGFVGSPMVDGLVNTYASVRSATGWTTQPLNLPAEFEAASEVMDYTPDLSQVLMLSATFAQRDDDTARYYFRYTDGTYAPASPPLKHLGGTGTPAGGFLEFDAATPDLSRFVISTSNVKILPGYDPTGSASASKNIYEVLNAGTDHASVRRVDLDDSGVVVGPLCAGRGPGGPNTSRLARGTNLISADGRAIFFSAFAQAASTAACTASARGRLRVMARIDGERTVEVSQSKCTRVADPGAVPPVTACNAAADVLFEGASSDGQTVYFTTTQQLTNDDTDTRSDLYEYLFASGMAAGTLRRVTTPAVGAPDAAANVSGIVAMSADKGQPFRVYFAAQGRITTMANEQGQQPSAGNNLYLYERAADHTSSRITFVTTLSSSDSGLWGMFGRSSDMADHGRILAFPSAARLTADDTDAAIDLYRYDAGSGALRKVSLAEPGWDGGNGEAPVIQGATSFGTDSKVGRGRRSVSADGSVVVFATREALSSRDINGAEDVYQWRDGVVSLITDGQGPEAGIVPGTPRFGVSEDGRSVAFQTQQTLLPEDGDGVADVYVARTDGGYLDTTVAPERCSGDACQGTTAAPPMRPNIGSVAFGGDGNVSSGSDPVKVSVGVKRLKAVTGSAAKLKVRVPGAGRIFVDGSSIRRSKRSVSKAGAYVVKIALRPRVKRLLRKRKRLRVSARVSYRAKSGRAAVKTIRVTFKQPKSMRAKSNKGGR